MASPQQPDGPKSLMNPSAFFEQRLPTSSQPVTTQNASATLTTSGDLTPRSINSMGHNISSSHSTETSSTPISKQEYNLYIGLHRLIAEDDDDVIQAFQSKIVEYSPSLAHSNSTTTPSNPTQPLGTTAAASNNSFNTSQHQSQIIFDLNFQHESIYNSCTFLMHACYRQNLQLILYLLSFHSQLDLNLQNIYSQESALFYTIVHCPIFTETTVHIVRELIQHDIDPNLRDSADLPVLLQLMRRSCEPISDFFLDIVATLLASTIPISVTISTREVANFTPLRLLLTNRYQPQRSALYLDLITMLLDHRQDDYKLVAKNSPNMLEHYRSSLKHASTRGESHTSILPFSDTFDPSSYIVMGLPELDYSSYPYQLYFPVVAAFMHPQPSFQVIKLLLNATSDVKIRSLLGPNRCSVIYTLFAYSEVLDDEIVQIIQYVMKQHAKQSTDSSNNNKNGSSSSLLKTTMALEAISNYPTRDIIGPKLLPCTPLPLLTSGRDGSFYDPSAPTATTPVNNQRGSVISSSNNPLTGSLKKKQSSVFSFGSPSQPSLPRSGPHDSPIPSYLGQNKHLLTQLHTLYQNLTQIESSINISPFTALQSSVLYSDKILSPMEQSTLPFFQQYPHMVTQLAAATLPNSSPITSQLGLSTFGTVGDHHNQFGGQLVDHYNQLLKVYEINSQTPLVIQDYHPFVLASSDGQGIWPVNKQTVIQVPLITSFLFNNRWRWSKQFQQVCELLTGQPLSGGPTPRRLYSFLHLVLMSPCPDYSIFYRLASLHHQNISTKDKDENPLPVIERALIYYLSNPNIDGPDYAANNGLSLTAIGSQPFGVGNVSDRGSTSINNSSSSSSSSSIQFNLNHPFNSNTLNTLTVGLPNPLSPSAPFQSFPDTPPIPFFHNAPSVGNTATIPAPLQRQGSLTAGTPPSTSFSAISSSFLGQSSPVPVSEDITTAIQQGRLGVYTNQQRLHIIARLSTPGKPKDISIPTHDDNITQLATLLIKHFHARPNYTVRIGNRTLSALSCIIGNSAIGFDTALTLFHSMIATRLASAGSTYVPSSAVLFWPDGTVAVPKGKDLPNQTQGLIGIEMAVYELVEWFVNSASTATSYLNAAALLFVLVKMRGVKLNDLRRGSTLWTAGERVMGLTRVSQEERTAKLNAHTNSELGLQGGGRDRRGTVAGGPGGAPTANKERKMSTMPGGRKQSVMPGTGPQGAGSPGGGNRRSTLGGQGPRGGAAGNDVPECQNWSIMTLLLCFGNYDAVGIFELYSFLDWNGNPVQPPIGVEQSLYNTNQHFSDTYKNQIVNNESIVDIFKFIINNTHRMTTTPRSTTPNMGCPNFCTTFGQFIFRRGLFLMQYVVKTEEIHPNTLVWEKIASLQLDMFLNKDLSPKTGVINMGKDLTRDDSTSSSMGRQLSANPLSLDNKHFSATNNSTPNGDDNDRSEIDDGDNGDDGEDGFGSEDSDFDDEDDESYGDFGATGARYVSPGHDDQDLDLDAMGRRTTMGPVVSSKQQDNPLSLALQKIAADLTQQGLLSQWVKPEWSPAYFGPRFTSYALRTQNDPNFVFTESGSQVLLQAVISIPNPNRSAQYHFLQFLLLNMSESLKASITAPLKFDLSSFGLSTTPLLTASSLSVTTSAPSSGADSGVPALGILGEDEISPLPSSSNQTVQQPTESRGRRGTVASGAGARARSTSRGRGASVAGGPGGAGEQKSDFAISITALLHTASAYDFYTVLLITLLEEHFSTTSSMPLHMTHLLPFIAPRFTNDLTATHDYHSLSRLQAKTATPHTIYSRANILTLLSMTHTQPITLIYMFLFEYFVRRYYHRLAAHLAIESAGRQVVIQICQPLQISPLFVLLHFSKLNSTFNPYLPTLSSSTGGFNPSGVKNTYFVPSLQNDFDLFYQPAVQPHPVMNWANTTSNIYQKYQRSNPNLLSTPIALLSSSNLVQTQHVSLFTPQLLNLVLQFETDYGRWIQPIDPAHLRAMYRLRPEHLHTGGRYNYKQTITYPQNLITYFFLSYRIFFLHYSSSFTSIHSLITALLLKHGHCPNYSIHDDDDIQHIAEHYPTPVHALLLAPHAGLVHTPAVTEMTQTFLNNRNYDPENGVNEVLVHLPFKTRTPVTTHQSNLLKTIVRSNVNLLRCDARDITNVLHHAFSNIQRPSVYTPQNFKSVAYLLGSGLSPYLTYQGEDQSFIGFIIASSGGSWGRFSNYPHSKHSDLWQTQLLVIFYSQFFLTPNNIAPNTVLALALHPNQKLKELIFGINDWSTTKPTPAEKACADNYFSNPLHFGNTSTNSAASTIQQQGNPHLSASYFTPGFVSLGAEFNIKFILKYKTMSLEQFITQRQAEMAATKPSLDYNMYDLLSLLDHHRVGITLPSFFSIAQRYKQSQSKICDSEFLTEHDGFDSFTKRNPDLTKLFVKQRNESLGAFPDTSEREKDQVIYKGLLWFLSDYTNTLSPQDTNVLLSITKSKLTPTGLKLLTTLGEAHGNLTTALAMLDGKVDEKEGGFLTLLADACPPSIAIVPSLLSNDLSSQGDLDLRASTVLQVSTGSKLLKPIEITKLSQDDGVIDCSAINSFRENIIHTAILRRWPAQTIKPLYLQAAYQFSIKFEETCSRAHLPQEDQITLEQQLLHDTLTNDGEKFVIKSLREQYIRTNGITMTKFQLDFALLFHDARGYSPLQYLYLSAYDIDNNNYMDQLFNHQFLASFVSKHHLKYTRYLEYQGFTAAYPTYQNQVQQQLLAQSASQAQLSGGNGIDESLYLSTDASINISTLAPQQRAFLHLSEVVDRQTMVDLAQYSDSNPTPNKQIDGVHFSQHQQLKQYNLKTITGNLLDEVQKLPFFSSLALMLSFDFNLFSPLPTNPKLFSGISPAIKSLGTGTTSLTSSQSQQPTTYPTLYKLFMAGKPLPIPLLPPVNLRALHQGHLWINMFDYDLRKNTPPSLKPNLINYSAGYKNDDINALIDTVSGAIRTTATNPRLNLNTLPLAGSDKLLTQHNSYLQKLGGGSLLSPKPKSPFADLIEESNSSADITTLKGTFKPNNGPKGTAAPVGGGKDGKKSANGSTDDDDENSGDAVLLGTSTLKVKTSGNDSNHDPPSNSLMSGLADIMGDDENKDHLLSPLREDDDDTNQEHEGRQKAILMKMLNGGSNGVEGGNDFYDETDDGVGDEKQGVDGNTKKENDNPITSTTPHNDNNAATTTVSIDASTSGPATALRSAAAMNKYASLPLAIAKKTQLVSIYQDPQVDPVDPTQPGQSAIFDYDMHIFDNYMSTNAFLVLTKDGHHRKLINSYTHNNTAHSKLALLTQQSIHEFLFKVQQMVYYQSLPLHDQLGVEIVTISDHLNTPLNFTKPQTLPPKQEMYIRRLSHSSSSLILHRSHRNRTTNPPTPKSPGDAVVEQIQNMPVSKHVLDTQADFTQPLSYARYFNLRYSYPTQQLKTVPCRSPTWLQYTKILYYIEFTKRDYSKWCLPPFAYSLIIQESINASSPRNNGGKSTSGDSGKDTKNDGQLSPTTTGNGVVPPKNNKDGAAKSKDAIKKDPNPKVRPKSPQDKGGQGKDNGQNDFNAPPEPGKGEQAGCCSLM